MRRRVDLLVADVQTVGPRVTLGSALDAATRQLAAAGIETARLDARLLVAVAAGCASERVLLDRDAPMPEGAGRRLHQLLDRRCGREPVARILGRREFWSLDFAVTPDTLDPRPDSEILVEAALAVANDLPAPRILDLGTGTGCLLLAVLSERPDASGVGVDIDPAACAVARRNAESLGLASRARFVQGDWCNGIAEHFNVILINPPYVRDQDMERLEPEVRCFDPRLALSGGADGLSAYRALIPDLHRRLSDTGRAVLEIGLDQAEPVIALLERHGLRPETVHCDLGERERCIVATAESLT